MPLPSTITTVDRAVIALYNKHHDYTAAVMSS
jgi:hypothetical protein